MTTPLQRFPDAQRLLIDALVVLVPSVDRTGAETPANLADVLPFIRVRRAGGRRDLITDRATVDIDVFAASYTAGELLAERVALYLCGPPPPVAVFDRIECLIAPQELPWGDGRGVHRFGTTYSVSSRRRAFQV